jgi:hypothetical protein
MLLHRVTLLGGRKETRLHSTNNTKRGEQLVSPQSWQIDSASISKNYSCKYSGVTGSRASLECERNCDIWDYLVPPVELVLFAFKRDARAARHRTK